MWKSVPQMPIRRMASSTSSAPRSGSGRSSSASSPGLRQTTTFMPFIWRAPDPREVQASSHHLSVSPDHALRQDDVAVEAALAGRHDGVGLLGAVVEGEALDA